MTHRGPTPVPRLLTPLRIALAYAVAGALYIVFSDRLLEALVTDSRALTVAQSAKGLCFIVVTAVALYLAIHGGTRALQRSSDALLESERRYRQMFEGTGAVMLLLDRETGEVLDANAAAADFYGWPRRQMVGRRIHEIEALPPDEVARKVALAAVEQRSYFVYPHRLASGDVRDVEVHSTPLDLGGRPAHFLIVHDITDRLRVESELAASEAKYRSLLAEAADGIAILSADDRIVEVNARLCQLLGYGAEELLGRSLAQFIPAEDRAREPIRLAELRAGKSLLVSRRFLRKDGSTVQGEISAKKLEGGGFQAIVRDVTERRHLEEQLRQAQKMEAVGQLTGGIAHDLNNVLTVVMTSAELTLLALPDDREDLRADLLELEAAAKRGAAMIARLLGFSRRASLNVVTLDLAHLVADLLPTLRRLLPAHIAISTERPAAPVLVRADAGTVEQVLLNLATNARDAMPGGGELHIGVSEQRVVGPASEGALQPGTFGCLDVRDTGHGMDEATRARVFEPFFSTKGPSEGTGLGMAMVYGLVQQQHGDITLESEPNVGTRVRVRLPGGNALPLPSLPSDDARRWPRGSETVLLVEDEAPLRTAARRILEKLGYTVFVAGDGEEGLGVFIANEDRIDVVVSDIVMPRLGGRGLYDAVRARSAGMRFLFSSGYGGKDIQELALEQGGPPLLQKPWTAGELAVMLRDVLEARA
jgi:two-component system, cell cycle sensor histidine kinase and response regulator CckA